MSLIYLSLITEYLESDACFHMLIIAILRVLILQNGTKFDISYLKDEFPIGHFDVKVSCPAKEATGSQL